jgi:DNA-binding LacI/PurR family transcriptional regulator
VAVTIYDVAKKAGVSPSTVSLIYNCAPLADRITACTRKKVEKAIKDLGYQPNAGARSMNFKRFEAIGVHLMAHSSSFSRGTFYSQVIDGIESAITDVDYLYIMCRSMDMDMVPKFLRIRCVDAVMVAHYLTEAVREAAAAARIPVLTVNCNPAEGAQSVNFDDASSMRAALDQLWAMGHRRIAYADSGADPAHHHYSRPHRLEAYRQWSADHGVADLSQPFMFQLEPTGAQEFVDWAKAGLTGPKPVTAMIFYTQDMFHAATPLLHGAGIHVPETLSAVACGLFPHSVYENDPHQLSGIEYDPYALGRLAAKTMTDFLHDGEPLKDHLLGGRWQEGNTTRCVR